MTTTVASLQAVLSADTTRFTSGLQGAESGLSGFATRIGASMTRVGAGMTAAVTAPLLAIGAAAASAAISWESDWAGVLKTVEGTAEELAELENRLREMATSPDDFVSGLENAHETLARIAELGGQLGVPIDMLDEFAVVVAQLTMATDLTAESAAMMMAQFANVTGMDFSDMERFGSVIVDLGNNMATTENMILQFGQRMAATGTLIGLSEAEILALGAAMASLGLAPEAGATSMNRIFQEMAVHIANAGDELDGMAELVGMTSEGFADLWDTDPMEAFARFLEGFSTMDLDRQIHFLDNLGLSGTRVTRVMQLLSGSTDLLRDSMDIAGVAWEESNALQQEAAQRAATTESRINELRNRLTDLGITIGTAILPGLLDLVRGLGDLVTHLADTNPEMIQLAVGLGLMAAVVGPALIVFGTLVTAVGALLSPVGLAVVGVAALGAALVGLGSLDLGEQIGSIFGGLAARIESDLLPLGEQIRSGIEQALGAALAGVGSLNLGERLGSMIDQALGGVSFDFGTLGQVLSDNLQSVVDVGFSLFAMAIGGPAGLAIGAGRLVAAAIEADFLGIGTLLQESGIGAAIEGALTGLGTDIQNILSSVFGEGGGLLDEGGLASDLTELLGGILSTGLEGLQDFWESSLLPGLTDIGEGLGGFFEQLGKIDTSGFDEIAKVLAVVGTALAGLVGSLLATSGDIVGGILSGIGEALPLIGEGIRHIVDAFSVAAETGDVGLALENLAAGLLKLGEAFLQFTAGIADPILEAIESLTGLDLLSAGEALATGGQILEDAFKAVELLIANGAFIIEGAFEGLRLRILEEVARLRDSILSMSGFLEWDIAPNIEIDLASARAAASGGELGAAFMEDVQAGFESGDMELTLPEAAFGVNVDGTMIEFTGTPEIAPGWRDTVIEAINMVFAEGDTESMEALIAIAPQLDIDIELLGEQMFRDLQAAGDNTATMDFRTIWDPILETDLLSIGMQAADHVTAGVGGRTFSATATTSISLLVSSIDTSAVQSAIQNAISGMGASASVGGGGGGGGGGNTIAGSIPGFQSGGIMPHTGLAFLHEGERVLSPGETRRHGGGGRTVVIENLQVFGQSPYEIVDMLERAVSEMAPA